MHEEKITYFAETDARNKRVPFGIKAKDRTRHVYVIGKTGMGKSTLLENMAVQDIRNGEGMAFIDPHGKTAELLLEYVPEERIKDVLYFAPFDTDFPISFNVMEDVGPDKRHLVANGLMSAFKKIWVDAWSARMEYILNNILLALLEYPGSTLIGVNRMLADKEYRKKVIDNITDVSVRAFWLDEFSKYGDRYMQEAGAAIQNKIGQFISNPLVRNIIGQPKSTFDIRKMMDSRKILIINLSKGRVGEANANLLGSMLITKIYLGAMSRADTPEAVLKKMPNFYLYVDEFQSFANESFADILSEARKYKLNLTIAHQYIEQMSEEVRAAVFGNVGTMISFRVGAYDAEVLEKEFAPQFTATDLVNLGMYQVYLKLMINGVTSPPFSASTLPPLEKPQVALNADIVEYSRKTFATPRNKVEGDIREWSQPIRPAFTERGDRGDRSTGRSSTSGDGTPSRISPAGDGRMSERFENRGEIRKSFERREERSGEKAPHVSPTHKLPETPTHRVVEKVETVTRHETKERTSTEIKNEHNLGPSNTLRSDLHREGPKFIKEDVAYTKSTSRVSTPVDGTTPQSKTQISLSELRSATSAQNPKETKEVKEKNWSDLRTALASVLKENDASKTAVPEPSLKTAPKNEVKGSVIPSSIKENAQDVASSKKESDFLKGHSVTHHVHTHTHESKKMESNTLNMSQKPQEIPEEVLRKVLEVKE